MDDKKKEETTYVFPRDSFTWEIPVAISATALLLSALTLVSTLLRLM